MSELLASPTQIQQLSRLRSLQVRRARDALLTSERALQAATLAVHRSESRIAALDKTLASLARDTVQTLAPALLRWVPIAAAERVRLLRVREIEAFMLSDASVAMDQASENVTLARAELARAQARDDMVTGLVRKVRAQHERALEQRVDVENDDVIGAAMAARGRAV
jgi:hypothetical protein